MADEVPEDLDDEHVAEQPMGEPAMAMPAPAPAPEGEAIALPPPKGEAIAMPPPPASDAGAGANDDGTGV